MKLIIRYLREQFHFFVIVPVFIVVMTWPTAYYVFETETFWLAGSDIDTHMLFWDAWYFKRLLAGQADYFFTDLLFYPEGASLAFHNFSLPHMALFAGLQTVMPAPNAYNLTFLILVFLTILSGYIYLRYGFQDKWICLFGAFVFGGCGTVLSRQAHPHVWFIATLPLSLYFMQRGIKEERARFMLVAGALLGFTAFIGMYTVVCMLITLGFCALYMALSRWRNRRFWRNLLLFSIVAGAVLLLRVYPMLADSAGLSDALGKGAGRDFHNDLIAYFANYANPLTGPAFEAAFGPNRLYSPTYLGYLPIILVILGLAAWRSRRDAIFWLLLLLMFLLLRLGATLTVGGVEYKSVLLPKTILNEALPYLFKPFWDTQNFQVGALLPLAVLSCAGLTRILQSLRGRRRAFAALVLLVALGLEYYRAVEPTVIPEAQLKFLDWLSSEPKQESIRLINLPMGGQVSKYYGFYQSFNGYPHVEGRPTRTPAAAFNYISSNLLLSRWRRSRSAQCFPGVKKEYLSSLNQLINDGFTHVVAHRRIEADNAIRYSFLNTPSAYEDEHVAIHRTEDMRQNCEGTLLLRSETARQLSDALGPGVIIPETGLTLLWLHAPRKAGDIIESEYRATLHHAEHTIRIAGEADGGFQAYGSGGPLGDADEIINWRGLLLLAYDPSLIERPVLESHRAWIAAEFKSCGRVTDDEFSVLEYFVKPVFPCELVRPDDSVGVNYENDLELGHYVQERVGDKLDFYFAWRQLPTDLHAVSLQLFDEDNAKALGEDFVIGEVPLAHQRMDLSALAPGEYVLKMIVYNVETGASLPGRTAVSGRRFKRELELTRLTLD